jgi:hypothetical protein
LLTSKVTETLYLPHEPGEWITVRLLSGAQIKEAREQRALAAIKMQQALSGLELKVTDAQRAEAEAALKADPVASYDRATLLRYAIVGWSYYDTPPTLEDIADLDEETAQYVAERVIPQERSETDQGNATRPSTPA